MSKRPIPSRDPRACGARRALTLCCACALLGGCGVSSRLFVAESDESEHADDAGAMGSAKPMDGGGKGDTASDGDSDRGSNGSSKALPCGTGPGCDPADLGGESCESLGIGGGPLLCDPTTCTFLTMLCTGVDQLPGCGTGPGCDPEDLGNATCESLGMSTGTLSCDPVNCTFDTSGCTGTAGTATGGLIGGGLFGGTTDADGGTVGGTVGGGLFGGAAGGGLFGGGAAGGGLFGGAAANGDP